MANWTGGCMCGAVRYALDSEPYDAGWCHCRICQMFSGSPAMAFATVPFCDWQVVAGSEQVRKIHTTSFGERQFCGACGTGLTMHVRHQADEIDFTICTLEEPGLLAPRFHIFWESKVDWFDPGDALPRHERFRPDTRGLSGTEPPGD
jgi:hypothetical protein